MRLNETQVEKLLTEGYSYEDITMFEQAADDAAQKGAKGLGTALGNIAKKATQGGKTGASAAAMAKAMGKVPGADTINQSLVQDQLIPGLALTGAAGLAANRALGNPAGKAARAVGNTIKSNPYATAGAGLGAALGPVGSMAGGALGHAVDAAGGIGNAVSNVGNRLASAGKSAANTLKGWFESKIAQGYPRPIVERFCDIHFGDKFLSENANKAYGTFLTESDVRVMNNHFNGWINEQWYKDAWDTAKSVAGKVGDTALDYAVPDFIAGPEAVKGAIGQGANAVGNAWDSVKNAMPDLSNVTDDYPGASVGVSLGAPAGALIGGPIGAAIGGGLGGAIGHGVNKAYNYFNEGKLDENQVSTLLESGYTYKDIGLYEQWYKDAWETAKDYAVPDFIATPDQVNQGIDWVGDKAKGAYDAVKGAMPNIDPSMAIAAPASWAMPGVPGVSPVMSTIGGGLAKAGAAGLDAIRNNPSLAGGLAGMPLGPLGMAAGGAAGMIPGVGDAMQKGTKALSKVAKKAAKGIRTGGVGQKIANALSKKENMSPDVHKESIRDWTTGMRNHLVAEQGWVPGPAPGPNPWDKVIPGPGPNPRPLPRPLPGPNPDWLPTPGPRPGPDKWDIDPRPRPVPGPNPGPRPEPGPNPWDKVIPGPGPRPGPNPNWDPAPNPGPNPFPAPGPRPRPGPGPKPNWDMPPRPGGGGGGSFDPSRLPVGPARGV